MIDAKYVAVLKSELADLQAEFEELRAMIGLEAFNTTLAADIKDLEDQIVAAEKGKYESA